MEDVFIFRINKDKIIINSSKTISEEEKQLEIQFSKEYITNNLDLVLITINHFIKTNHIDTCIINTNKDILLLLDLIKNSKDINKLIFKNSIIINKEIFDKLTEDNYLRYIEFYDMSNDLSNKFKNSVKVNIRNRDKRLQFLSILFTLIIIISLLVFTVTSYIEYIDFQEVKETISDIDEIKMQYDDIENLNTTEYQQMYYDLSTINEDTIGYIKINNTNINYPVVQTIDNNYYLNHDYKKNNNNNGWLFMDYRNDPNKLNENTIIYGHNIKSKGIMFGDIYKMFENNYFNDDNNSIIIFNNKDTNMKWKIFSIYISDDSSNYLKTTFKNNDEYKEFITNIKNKSKHDFNISLNNINKILTLSTCHSDTTRYVVHAYLIQ